MTTSGQQTGILKGSVNGPIPATANVDYLTPSSSTAVTFGTINGTVITGTEFLVGTLSYSDTGILEALQSSTNSYNQLIIQNTNTGSTASTDFVISNNLGTATTYYGNLGMNGSNYSSSGVFNTANAVYLSATTGDLVLGTTTSNAIHFVVNGGLTDSLTINSSGTVFLPALSNGLLKTSGGTGQIGLATSGTDYAPATSGTSILYGNGSGGFSNATVGTGLNFSTGTLSNPVTNGYVGWSTGTTDGSAIATGQLKGFFTAPWNGTITGYYITADQGTLTFKTWKVATGTAVPTVSNSISTSGVSLSTGTAIKSSTTSDFTTTTITAGDIIAFQITAVSAATYASGGIIITRST